MRRAPVERLAPGERTLSTETSRHLCRVLRMRVGGLRPSAVAGVELHLVYALAKGDKVDAVVRDATELGATRIVLVRTARSVVKVDDGSAAAKVERWSRIAVEAARQCGRADPPAIAIEDFEAAITSATTPLRFVLDPLADAPLASLLTGAATTFAIGAEGGLSDEEIRYATSHAFVRARLGRFVLRTETAATAALAAFAARIG